MLKKLLFFLNDGQYHQTTALQNKLTASSSDILNAIKKLKKYGVQIDSIQHKGHVLLEPLILLDEERIKCHLTNQEIDIEIFENIDSTNAYLKSFTASNTPRICLAEYQTQGKGRLNREWHSPFAQNIYFSCLYLFQKKISEMSGLSLVVSLAVLHTLSFYGLSQSLKVKWPNDVIYDHKKISGNLIDVQIKKQLCSAIIGIGINVNMLSDQENNISQAWVSLRQILAKYIDRNELCALLINNLFLYLKKFEKEGIASFVEEWNAADYLLNKNIILQHADSKISGKSQGINDQGHIVIKTEDGSLKTFSSGDTRIIKI